MAIDISHLKKDNEIILSCEKRNKETGVIDLVEKKYFYPHYGDSFFTKQEKTILQYMTDGLNSKMIAFKLELSLKTIETHRSNMLRKTNSKNIVELIMFAVRNKML
jgi:DNA-binding NarL/FixJ family response regulator